MARIRTIKPEFFTSEDIVSLSPYARLLYIALWCEADKEGRMAWRPKTFKMRYLPADAVDIDALCTELVSAGLVKLYGDGFAYIPGFQKHQHVNPRESVSTLPAPEGVSAALPRKVGKNTKEAVLERDGHKCTRCGSEDSLQIDHILPQSMGGPHIIENLRVLCRSCNAARPVSGKALDEDLKIDGYTVEKLREKFGIDASFSGLHAQVGREGKGKEGKEHASARDASFERFWKAYPNKVGKDAARKAFEKRKPDDCLVDCMVAAVELQKQSLAWTKDGGQFIPHPATWLNQGRWQDESSPSGAATTGDDWRSNPTFAGAI